MLSMNDLYIIANIVKGTEVKTYGSQGYLKTYVFAVKTLAGGIVQVGENYNV